MFLFSSMVKGFAMRRFLNVFFAGLFVLAGCQFIGCGSGSDNTVLSEEEVGVMTPEEEAAYEQEMAAGEAAQR
ncbi:hypothetical protein [Crateriforma conspicua]|uniref:hypothetical protein n=1 Tax=Crateriforma conspicua TaxID=2527996 RepID=UPI00119F46B3|nr:hypothetical protein [Crateriforma conspicua]